MKLKYHYVIQIQTQLWKAFISRNILQDNINLKVNIFKYKEKFLMWNFMTLPNTRFPLVSQSKASVNFLSQSEASEFWKIQMIAEKAGWIVSVSTPNDSTFEHTKVFSHINPSGEKIGFMWLTPHLWGEQ